MIELTTGLVFLMSSLYGAGQTNAHMTANAFQALDIDNTATSTFSTKVMNTNEVEEYVRKEFADTPILIEIARCESNFHQYDNIGRVVRGIVNKYDVGVMQINEKYHADEALRQNIDIYSTEGNLRYGKYLYEKYGTDPWNSSSPCWSKVLAQK